MHVEYKIATPDEIEATVVLTATVKDFKELKRLLDLHPSPNHWPLGSVQNAIRKVITDATAHFEDEQLKNATL